MKTTFIAFAWMLRKVWLRSLQVILLPLVSHLPRSRVESMSAFMFDQLEIWPSCPDSMWRLPKPSMLPASFWPSRRGASSPSGPMNVV
ncbi:hypothetical protein CD790_32885 [Streptomyces sp. SAJ15]|nr:hypothetical protein CD790_32885 [Streptomyces sp. SAJ15]